MTDRPILVLGATGGQGGAVAVRHDQTPLESIRNPDMFAMWGFLNGLGYLVDVEALRDENPDIAWTTFADWARQSIE